MARRSSSGRIIVQSASSLKFDVTWAAILMAAIAGIVFYLIVVAVERLRHPVAFVGAKRGVVSHRTLYRSAVRMVEAVRQEEIPPSGYD